MRAAGWTGLVDVLLLEAERGHLGAVPRPPLLEVDLPIARHDLRVDLGVGRRMQRGAERPARAEPSVHVAHALAGAQPGRARDVRAEIQVTEGEPVGRRAPCGELGGHALGLPVRPHPRSVSFTPASA